MKHLYNPKGGTPVCMLSQIQGNTSMCIMCVHYFRYAQNVGSRPHDTMSGSPPAATAPLVAAGSFARSSGGAQRADQDLCH
eukprot:m.117483 g.117483  ORF g.117483 m.117483 type:complete len:81 (-) comp17183_c0_seq52:531-773(-)